MSRKPIEENVKRRLFAESMGRCMNPNCRKELFESCGDIIEKAHIDPEMAASYGSKQTDTQMRMESQFNGFDDLPDTFMAAEDDIPF